MSKDVERVDKVLRDLKDMESKLDYLIEIYDRVEKKTAKMIRYIDNITEKLESIEIW